MRRIAWFWVALLMIAALGFAACRRAEEATTVPAGEAKVEGQSAASTPTAKTEPTRITDVGLLATHVWAQPTTIIQLKDTPTPTVATSPDEKTIARGKTLFESKGCVQCHGANAEGISGKGAKLAGTSLTEAQFFEILRTGDRGRLGNDHLYGVFHISDSGVRAVYAYLRSLAP